MPPKNKNNPAFVSLDLCASKHESLAKEIGMLTTETKTIKNALIGEDMKSGIFKDVNDIKNKIGSGWKSKDKALLLVAVVEGLVAIAIALLGKI